MVALATSGVAVLMGLPSIGLLLTPGVVLLTVAVVPATNRTDAGADERRR
jgi:hypothetical protein